MNPTILIEPVALFREGLRRILEDAGFTLVCCADRLPATGLAIDPAGAPPLMIISDQSEAVFSQIGVLRAAHKAARVVLLSDSATHDGLTEALRRGADTIALRRFSCEVFIASLKLVRDGLVVFPAEMLGELVRQEEEVTAEAASLAAGAAEYYAPPTFDLPRMSAREMNVIQQLTHGRSNKEIARHLNISEATVKVHVKSILRKARVRNRIQVALWASQQQIGLSPEPSLSEIAAEIVPAAVGAQCAPAMASVVSL